MLWALHILLVWPKTRGALLSLNKKGMIFPIITISSSLPGSWLAPRQPNFYFDRNAPCMFLLYIYVLDVRLFVLRFNGNHGPNTKKRVSTYSRVVQNVRLIVSIKVIIPTLFVGICNSSLHTQVMQRPPGWHCRLLYSG